MSRFGKGDEVGKPTYLIAGWKVSVLSIKKGYTQIVSKATGESLFFDSESEALAHIDNNKK